uniref:RNA-directed RNA polymerase n=1 Tax=Meloidogyne hapla TaxID=6305 RepID=A0A1I8B592_MELHA
MEDLKLVFFHHNSKKLEKASHVLVEDVLGDPRFNSRKGTVLGFVDSPKSYDDSGDEPRVEYPLGIGGRCKHISIIFILEHLMNLLRETAIRRGTPFTKLRYTVLIPAASFSNVHMSPFKRHFSAVDEYYFKQISFGNVLGYNQLYVQQKIVVSEDVATTLKVNKGYLPRLAIARAAQTQMIKQTKSISFDSGTGSSLINGQSDEQKQSCSNFTPEESDEDDYKLRERTPSPDSVVLPEENYIIAEFEHDLRVLNLRFFVPYDQKKNWRVLDQIRLVIKYESIKQVHLELEKRSPNTFWARLMLRLKYPVQIWRIDDVFSLKNGRGIDRRQHKGNRVNTWGRDDRLAEDLANSSVIVLDFMEQSPERLSAIIGRLMGLLKLDLELRNIEERNLPPEFDNDFELYYWIEALGSRGYVVIHHWIDECEQKKFFKTLIDCYNQDRQRTLTALEMLSDRLLDRSEVRHRRRLTGLFQDIERDLAKNQIEQEELKSGFVRLKKVIITPSRVVLCGNEVLMGNRVVRIDPTNYPTEKFLRIVFRDEDGSKVHSTSIGGTLIDSFIKEKLRSGMTICEKTFLFLGTSNSQMREGGCYFLQTELEELGEFRRRLGLFDQMPTIPKMMSRLGLCFTQGKDTNVDMGLQMLGFDFIGGPNSNGEHYIISDGCGCMSMAVAGRVAEEMELDPVNPPSCFQFRYAGYKGVLSVNPNLDAAKKCFEKHHNSEETRESYMAVDFYFRPSQKKFDIQQEEERLCRFEVVKYSSPVPLFLNKPLINILDQVSKLHSTDSHERICKRLHMLLDRHVFSLCSTLTDELRARSRLSELPRYVEYDMLETVHFTQEPFFRLVLRAAGRVSLFKLRQKLAIAIPYQLGSVMFGIVDETDSLQYGQVFVQYSNEMSSFDQRKTNKKHFGKKIIVKGPVLISKNPAIVGGDVRIFEAVDVPALHHLVDVLVFPRFGPRPHSDEMAGSDLDGDEYGVIWDPELAFNRNEPPADYTPVIYNEEAGNNFDHDDFQDKMAEFFVNYLKHDSIGRIANAHLACSDLYGIKTKVCGDIARKHQQAVDFPKTGKHSAPLLDNWRGFNPPEKFERAPDFMEKECSEPQYQSSRLNGQLYRRVNELSDFLSSVIAQESTKLPDPDEMLISNDGQERYLTIAQTDYNLYSYRIKRLMDEYGIQCEGELFSSSYSVIRNRLSDRETDDMSFFNTTYIIGQRLWEIGRLTRKQFFASAGGKIEKLTDARGICVDPSEKLQLLARAYYTIVYNVNKRQCLSFPWVACWDVLDKVKRTAKLKRGVTNLAIDPFADRLFSHIKLFVRKCETRLEEFREKVFQIDFEGPEEDYERKCFLRRYAERYRGLDILLFFCIEWAQKQKLFELSPIREEHLCLLVVSTELSRGTFYETPTDWSDSPLTPSADISSSLGRRFFSFLEVMASLQFERKEIFDFRHFGLEYQHFLNNGEWRMLQQIALNTYLHLVFSDQLDIVLPSIVESENLSVKEEEILEGSCFQLELPSTTVNDNFVEYYKLLEVLCKESGCERIMMRCHPRYKFRRRRLVPNSIEFPRAMRILVTTWGKKQAIERLRQLLAIKPQMDLSTDHRLAVRIIPEVTLELFNELLDRERDNWMLEYMHRSNNQIEEEIEEILENEVGEEELVEYYDDSE